MPAPKNAPKPQDRKPKADEVTSELFTFTDPNTGTEYEAIRSMHEVVTPGFLRKNRKLSETDQAFTVLEALFGDDTPAMDALDNMDMEQWGEIVADMFERVGVSLGE